MGYYGNLLVSIRFFFYIMRELVKVSYGFSLRKLKLGFRVRVFFLRNKLDIGLL